MTAAEVVTTFNDYSAQWSAAGVVLAKAVSDVRFSNGTVNVAFDPGQAGISEDQFDYINPFPNIASFVASPIAFNDNVRNRIRPVVRSIVTARADGAPLGSFKHAEILALNGLTE